MATLELSSITVVKDGSVILSDVDLSVGHGELMVLVGPSGAGKTTVLRVVGGLQPISGGELLIGGVPSSRLAPHERNVAMVFQSDALYPFMNVRKNVSFPLEMRHQSRAEIDDRVGAESRALGIEDLMKRRPAELSAGQQQLVQIARAMVRAPDLFLMDEPLAQLDAALRLRMRDELCTVQRGYGVTTLYVTNDPVEAMAVADRMGVIVGGTVVQVGEPMEVYRRPLTRRVAEVTGDVSVVEVTVEEDPDGFWLTAEGLRHRMWTPLLTRYVGTRLDMVVRPEDLALLPGGPMHAKVVRATPYGSHVQVVSRSGPAEVTLRLPVFEGQPGDHFELDILHCVLFDQITGRLVA